MKDVISAVKHLSDAALKLEDEHKIFFSYVFSWRFLSEIRYFESSFSLYSKNRTDVLFLDIIKENGNIEFDKKDVLGLIEEIDSRIPAITQENGILGVCGQYGYIGLIHILEFLVSNDDGYLVMYIEKYFDIVDYLSQEMHPELISSSDEIVLNSGIFKEEYGQVLELIRSNARTSRSIKKYLDETTSRKSLYQKWIL